MQPATTNAAPGARPGATSAIVTLPKKATVGPFETELNAILDTPTLPEELWIDLRASEYIEIATLTHLLALIVDRRKQGLVTRIYLPRAIKPRQFLRRWLFQNAIFKAAGEKLSEMVHPSNLKYFRFNDGDASEGYDGVVQEYNTPEGPLLARLELDNFFGFQIWTREYFPHFKRVVLDQSTKWNDQKIKAALKKHLDNSSCIGSHVIHAALSNAFRHSEADTIAAVSHIERHPVSRKPIFLTVVCWDNGKPIYESLGRTLRSGLPVVSESPIDDDLHRRYEFCFVPTKGSPLVQLKDSRTGPKLEDSDAELLLKAIYPGVTCDPAGRNAVVDPAVVAQDARYASPGMGLYVLIDTVVQHFRGSVAIRTGGYFLNARKPDKKDKHWLEANFRVKVTEVGSMHSQFPGNMLTIRIPLKS